MWRTDRWHEEVSKFKIVIGSEESNKLDPDEVHEGQQLSEGSYAIVYKGIYKGNQVAIKKMKEDVDCTTHEFNKEVFMLEELKYKYNVHFYGTIFGEGKLCMVIELAKYGSLWNLIKQHEIINECIRMKILLDGAKGIKYLYDNYYIHLDIKPDNILVFDIDNNKESIVNGKLTDSGTTLNCNKDHSLTLKYGVGTPKYIAPEVSSNVTITTASDIFSFAITM